MSDQVDRQEEEGTAIGVVQADGLDARYEAFYGLKRRPFLSLPDPDFVYWSESQSAAHASLRQCLVTRAPIAVVTGPIGSGKTALLRNFLSQAPLNVTTGLISNMQSGRGELLLWAMMAFDRPLDPQEPYVALFKRFQDFLIETYAKGRHTLLIIDEAQNLSSEDLEELRMLANINADSDELLQIVLIGQPELRELIAQPRLAQFAQRVALDIKLGLLSRRETADYIGHRLAIAGATREIFTAQACAKIHEITRGVPRVTNILCDLCLAQAFSRGQALVDGDLVAAIVADANRQGLYRQFFAPLPEEQIQGQPVLSFEGVRGV
ncbi:MAG: AAA family ATPase [Rhodospirillales bacterium]